VTRDETAKVPSAEHGGAQPAASPQQAGPPAATPSIRDPRAARAARAARWRQAVSTATELAGIGVLSAGFWLIRPWAGLIVLGAGLIVLGFAGSPRFDRHVGPR
jgi:hypothetical protein